MKPFDKSIRFAILVFYLLIIPVATAQAFSLPADFTRNDEYFPTSRLVELGRDDSSTSPTYPIADWGDFPYRTPFSVPSYNNVGNTINSPYSYSKAQVSQFSNDFDTLFAKARSNGSVRVVVELDVDFSPEGNFRVSQDIDHQRLEIKQAQNAVVSNLQNFNVKSVHQYKYIPYLAMEIDPAGLAYLLNTPLVREIREDKVLSPSLDVSVPLINADDAWAFGYRGDGQTIAILDTGVDATHPFLSGKIVEEACFSSTMPGIQTLCPNGQETQIGPGSAQNCDLSIEGCAHGTHVAGIAAGKGTEFSGVAKDANIIAIQVFSEFQMTDGSVVSSFVSDIIEALEYVYELRDSYHIAAVNMSLGTTGVWFSDEDRCDEENQFTKAAIDNLRSAGIATVVASGNEGHDNALAAPACISTAVSVGATTSHAPADQIAEYSNSANILDLLAPGSDINSSVPGGGFESWNGTSMAAPHVAGAWAILKEHKPDASVDEILRDLQISGVDINHPAGDLTISRIDVYAALTLVIDPACHTLSLEYTGSGSSPTATPSHSNGCPAGKYVAGERIYVKPHPAPGWALGSWEGTQSNSSSFLRMPAKDHTVTAHYVEFSCDVVADVSPSECEALIALYNNTDGNNWTNRANWFMTAAVGDWYGIWVFDGHVTNLILDENNLKGNIPAELSNLTNLAGLSFWDNDLTGNIPAEIGNLSKLNYLGLAHNQLTGHIPPELGNLSNLELLYLQENELTGNIPTEFENFSKIYNLWLNNNQLTGNIPNGFGDFQDLYSLNLMYNQLTGSIPSGFGILPNLTYMYLYYNNLSGEIPVELGNSPSLGVLALAGNHLTGSIPAQLGSIKTLVDLSLAENHLTGEIPVTLGDLAQLQYLELGQNLLSGNIPVELSNLSILRTLELGGNHLVGQIPPELANLPYLVGLNLENNELSGTIPVELGNLSELWGLWLQGNQLIGFIPATIGNLTNLNELNLANNALSGEIPHAIINLSNLNSFTDFRYNALYSSDPDVLAFLAEKNNNWDYFQTVAPASVTAVKWLSPDEVKVLWDPIPYSWEEGYYEVSYSKNPDSPFTVAGITSSKMDDYLLITGLSTEYDYYFRVRTFSVADWLDPADLWSSYSEVIPVTPLSTIYLPLVHR